jgi:type II secretory pathway pseudopilin PulG
METLITMLLVMMIFGMVADLLSKSYRVARVQRQKNEAAEAAQMALTRLTGELREACKVDFSAGQEVTLYKVNAARTLDVTMLPEVNRYRENLKVRYHLDASSTLLREVETYTLSALESTQSYVVADNIQGLNVSQDPNTQNIIVAMTVNVRGVLRIVSSEVAPLAVLP